MSWIVPICLAIAAVCNIWLLILRKPPVAIKGATAYELQIGRLYVKTGMCNHLLVGGLGGMGDALVCVKCGLDKYPEAWPQGVLQIAEIKGRIKNPGCKDYAAWVDLAHSARRKRIQRQGVAK